MQVTTTRELQTAVMNMIEHATGTRIQAYDQLRVATQYLTTLLSASTFTDEKNWDAPYQNWNKKPLPQFEMVAWDSDHFALITVDFTRYTAQAPQNTKIHLELLPLTAVTGMSFDVLGESMYSQDGESWDIDTDITVSLADGRSIEFPWHYGNNENILGLLPLIGAKR
ncbi:hypothetical protein VR010_03045 [Actinomycetaceae bacterium L2_0104]